MRRLLLLAVLALGLAACGWSSATTQTPTPIAFGVEGTSVRPLSLTIQANGTVQNRGRLGRPGLRQEVSPATVKQLDHAIEAANLRSKDCPGVPYPAVRYIRARGRTVTVRGLCEGAFEGIWAKLYGAVSYPPRR